MKKWTEILNLITIVSLSSMTLFILLIINYAWIRSSRMIENIYIQIVLIYGLPIIAGLCLVPMKMTASTLQEVGICRNHKTYQDVLSFLGATVFLVIFLYQNSKGQMEGSYVLQFLFVGIGEEIFFRAILL